MFIDMTKILNGKVPEDEFAFVQLPDGTVLRLERWLLVVRLSAQAREYASKLVTVGFARAKSNSCASFTGRLHVIVRR